MNEKSPLKGISYKFEKKQKPKLNPFVLGLLSGFLALLGIMIIIMVVAGSSNPFGGLFAKSPTPTETPTLTPFPTFTATAAATEGPTITNTPSGPQLYLVVEGDSCFSISQAFEVSLDVLLAVNGFSGATCPIIPGQTITIPAQGQEMPTRTPLPTGLPRGTEIKVTVASGDTLQSIADEFDSTVESIKNLNNITDENSIYVGQVLRVRINLATRTPTLAPTSTVGNLVTPLPSKTPTPKP